MLRYEIIDSLSVRLTAHDDFTRNVHQWIIFVKSNPKGLRAQPKDELVLMSDLIFVDLGLFND